MGSGTVTRTSRSASRAELQIERFSALSHEVSHSVVAYVARGVDAMALQRGCLSVYTWEMERAARCRFVTAAVGLRPDRPVRRGRSARGGASAAASI
jgi:hypothetical protein